MLKFYIKYGLLSLITLTVLFTALLYKTYFMSKDRRKYRNIVIIIFLVFISFNILLIYVMNYQLSILYRNVLAPSICTAMSTVIFIKPKQKETK